MRNIFQLYDIDGVSATPEDTIRLIQEIVDDFKSNNSDFIGLKIIYSRRRYFDNNVTESYLKKSLSLSEQFPDIVVGFDLVDQEDVGHSLLIHAPVLVNKSVNYFFHAGETNWFGTEVDENLIDAVLLGTKRIGHGYAIVKHPDIQKIVKLKGICLEISPISNKMLHYVQDLRNHPVASLIAEDVPIVISSDDPSFFRVSPLSHDFYLTFVGISSAHSDLRLLKQLAINSIIYSSMSNKEKAEAMDMWLMKWDQWIDEMLK